MADNYKEELPFGDFLSSERISEVLDYSTNSKIKKAKYTNHVRAVVDTVDGDFANIVLRDDTNLGDPDYTIYNVKIRDGLILKNGDNVYVQYINNNTNNMFIDFKVDQFEIMFDLYDKKQYKLIDNFQDNSGWTSGAGTQSNDLIHRKIGDKGLKIAEDDNTGSTLYSTKSSLTLDLTVFDDSSTSSTNDSIFLAFYVSDSTLTTSVTLTITTSAGNDFYYVYTSFSDGWNLSKTSKVDFSETGSPDWSTITEIKLSWISENSAINEFITFGALYLIQSGIKISGEFVLEEPVWDDSRFSATQTKLGSNLKPDFDETNVGYAFADNSTAEILYIVAQMPHNWKEGSTIYPHIHWLQNQNQNVDWEMDYKWFNNNTAVPASFTNLNIATLEYTYVSGNLAQISTTASGIDGTGKKISSILVIKLWRNTTDSYSGDALFFEFDIHYQVDGFGSYLEYVK